MQSCQGSQELWDRWHQVKRLLLYNPKRQKFVDLSEYHQISSACDPEQVVGLHKNCALFEFVKEYPIEEIKKLIFNTMDAVTARGTKQHTDVLCKFIQ